MLADKLFGAPERKPPPRRKKPAAKRRPAQRAPQKRAGSAARSARRKAPPSPEVMQRRMDLLGLCFMALAVYLGYVIYLGWNGGTAGNAAETGLAYAVGKGAVVFPVVPRARRAGADHAAADALSGLDRGRGVRDRRRVAAGPRRPDGGARA